MRVTIDDPRHGAYDVLGFPIKFTDEPCSVHRPPPDLGEHTDALLAELGYAGEAIERMRQARVI